ncbi:MAG TPA: Trm112 family protein [Methylomirabilota bacterium]|nr:Trm112 family protein [Methylomirabilota bacterium]
MIDSGLLKMLCCPETHQQVKEAEAAFVAELNNRIAAGGIKTRAGKMVKEKVEGALLRHDRQVAYPIRNRIPVMLVEEAILLG